MGSQTAARILNQRTDDHICADVARLDGFHKLAVAVIDHADDIGTDGLDERDQLADLLDGERRAGGVALAALDGDELGARVDRRADAVVINRAVRLERNLRIAHAVFLERAGAFADADDLFQRVIRAADGESSSSPGSRLALSATASAWVPQVICGRTSAASVWKQSA